MSEVNALLGDDPVALDPVRSVLIAGGGTAGWMAAAVLARALPKHLYTIRLVEPARPPEGLELLDGGEACLPGATAAIQAIGMSADDLLRGADATFSLGGRFAGFARPDTAYFRPFGLLGVGMEGVAFHNLWERVRREGGIDPLADFSLAAVAAGLGRFAPPSDDPRSVQSTYNHGWHWDGARWRGLVRAAAEQAGVARIEGGIADVELRAADGFIAAVALADGRKLEADLFFDCTGAQGLLIEGALETGWEDWRRWLPCDRAMAGRVERSGDPLPYRGVEAHDAGWSWRIPLRSGDGCGLVYAGDHLADADAAALLDSRRGVPPDAPVRFASGRRRAFWARNCIALGDAACVLDPVEPTALQIVLEGVWNFLSLMPDKRCDAGESAEYNRLMGDATERMRDLAILHYKATARADSAFWNACRTMEVPDVLAHKMRVFDACGRVLELDEETFLEEDWAAVYFGQELAPRHYDALADVPPVGLLRERMAGMRRTIRAAAEAMPAHGDFIAACLGGARR